MRAVHLVALGVSASEVGQGPDDDAGLQVGGAHLGAVGGRRVRWVLRRRPFKVELHMHGVCRQATCMNAVDSMSTHSALNCLNNDMRYSERGAWKEGEGHPAVQPEKESVARAARPRQWLHVSALTRIVHKGGGGGSHAADLQVH